MKTPRMIIGSTPSRWAMPLQTPPIQRSLPAGDALAADPAEEVV